MESRANRLRIGLKRLLVASSRCRELGAVFSATNSEDAAIKATVLQTSYTV